MQVTRVAPGWPVPSLMHRRRVMADRITYVGFDVHKETIVVAVAAGGLRGEVREYGCQYRVNFPHLCRSKIPQLSISRPADRAVVILAVVHGVAGWLPGMVS